MLSPYSKPQFIEKIITSQTGEQFRVIFLVAIVAGDMRAKIVSAVALSATPVVSTARDAVLAIAAPIEKVAAVFSYVPAFAAKISPYFSLDFFVSQPTRAPSFN
jgi:hypothetical protein